MKRSFADLAGLPAVYGSRIRVLLLAYFVTGLVVVFLGSILFAGHTARRMERQAATLTSVFSLFISETAFRADRPAAFQLIQNIIREVDFPLIITDAHNVPLVWRGVDVAPSEAEDPTDLARPDLDPSTRQKLQRLEALIAEFDRDHAPYPIEVDGAVQAYVHFGVSTLSRQLRWMPVVLVIAVAIFTAVGLLGIRSMKRSEQRSIWVGMARETAHQLGTPLTSLLGWVQLLRSGDDPHEGESVEDARRRRHLTYDEMEHDLERLSKVSARFSKIGSTPDLSALDMNEVLHDIVEYIRRRTPHLGARVQIEVNLEPMPLVLANRELLEWAFENLLKNAVDALQNGGAIRVQGRDLQHLQAVELRVADDGKGIPVGARKRIWEPGFTTKQRGWGLGLSLVRRIIVDHHRGRIWVEDNEDRRGICFVVRLSSAPPEARAD